ncbi:MAG: hypothetical protein JWR72_2925, partial [Flavisolibacter sp.]|nr:hypothetical protein [Flavisolibacter sp.]
MDCDLMNAAVTSTFYNGRLLFSSKIP